MLRRITLENFMSHQHTVIDLADGLTVLTGPNNCGKSAVVAALQILASNGKTTHVMRHGAKECSITAETDDGHTICWQRKKASVSYTIDGERINRVGQGVPEALHRLLKLPSVEADAGKTKVTYDIHFGEQKSPVFLLGDPGSRAASFFAAASDASRLLEMTVKHRSRVKENRLAAKRLTAELESCSTELTRLSPVAELETRLEAAEQLFAGIEQANAASRRLKDLAAEIQRAVIRRQARQTELTVLKRVCVPPTQHDTPSLSSLIRGMRRSVIDQQNSTSTIRLCQSLTPPPELEATQECRRQLLELTTTVARCRQLGTETTVYQSLVAPPEIHHTDALHTRISMLQQTSLDHQHTSQQVVALQSLQPPQPQHDTTAVMRAISDLMQHQQSAMAASRAAERLSQLTPPIDDNKTDSLQETIRSVLAISSQTADAQQQTKTSQAELIACETELREFVSENPRCGTCGADVDPDRILNAVPGMEGHRHE